MFGLSQQEKEERSKADAIEQGLDIALREFNDAVSITADALGLRESNRGDPFRQDRYLAVIYAYAIALANRVGASDHTREKALKKYFAAFMDGESLYSRTVLGNLYLRYRELMNDVSGFVQLVWGNPERDDRDTLVMSLAQAYLVS